MTKKAREVGILPGWYGNNCHCKETVCKDEKCFAGDVQATLNYGFESIKLDGCGVEKNVSLYASLFNKTGKPIMIENCHNGNPTYPTKKEDGSVNCPMNFFRSSTDVRPTFGSVLINLQVSDAPALAIDAPAHAIGQSNISTCVSIKKMVFTG
jgi:alpha-galactosidase